MGAKVGKIVDILFLSCYDSFIICFKKAFLALVFGIFKEK